MCDVIEVYISNSSNSLKIFLKNQESPPSEDWNKNERGEREKAGREEEKTILAQPAT